MWISPNIGTPLSNDVSNFLHQSLEFWLNPRCSLMFRRVIFPSQMTMATSRGKNWFSIRRHIWQSPLFGVHQLLTWMVFLNFWPPDEMSILKLGDNDPQMLVIFAIRWTIMCNNDGYFKRHPSWGGKCRAIDIPWYTTFDWMMTYDGCFQWNPSSGVFQGEICRKRWILLVAEDLVFHVCPVPLTCL